MQYTYYFPIKHYVPKITVWMYYAHTQGTI